MSNRFLVGVFAEQLQRAAVLFISERVVHAFMRSSALLVDPRRLRGAEATQPGSWNT